MRFKVIYRDWQGSLQLCIEELSLHVKPCRQNVPSNSPVRCCQQSMPELIDVDGFLLWIKEHSIMSKGYQDPYSSKPQAP